MSSSILFAQAGQPPKSYYPTFKSQGAQAFVCYPHRSFYQLQVQQKNPRPLGCYQFFRTDRVISPLIALLSQQVISTSVQEGSKEPASEGQSPKGYWHTFKPHVVEVVAASGAIVPVFWLFQSKSALQTG